MGNKVYLQPRDYVIATIHDIKEWQKGKGTFADIPNGQINFLVRLYNAKWEYQFTVTDVGRNRCRVEIRVGGNIPDKEVKIFREFALLDSMLSCTFEQENLPQQAG